MLRFSCHLLLASTSLAAGAFAAPQFVALLQEGGQAHFVLSEAGESSDWLTVGRSFRGYNVVGYDRARDVLTVTCNGQTTELPLKDAHVRALAAADPLAPDTVTRDDLIVRDSGPVRMTLLLGAPWGPQGRRVINVVFDAGSGRAGMVFGPDGPAAISRATVPEAVRDGVSDDDISAINAHLATVRAKLGLAAQ